MIYVTNKWIYNLQKHEVLLERAFIVHGCLHSCIYICFVVMLTFFICIHLWCTVNQYDAMLLR